MVTYIGYIDSHVEKNNCAHSKKHSNGMLSSRPADLTHNIIGLFKPRKGKHNGKKSVGVSIGIAGGIIESIRRASVFVGPIGCVQTSSTDNDGSDDDEQQNHDLDYSE